jgi:hypothetical protein
MEEIIMVQTLRKGPKAKRLAFDVEAVLAYVTRYAINKAAYERHRRKSPKFFKMLARQAFIARREGMVRIGIDELFCRTRRANNISLTNTHKPFYARALLLEHPSLRGFIVTRKQFSKHYEG